MIFKLYKYCSARHPYTQGPSSFRTARSASQSDSKELLAFLDELAVRFKAILYLAIKVAFLREVVLTGKDFEYFEKGFVTN